MTRALVAVFGTVVGVVALLTFKTHPLPPAAAGHLPSASVASPSTTTGAPPVPGGSGRASATHPASATQTIAGRAVDTRYGTVQVQIVVSGRKIQQVSFLQLTANDSHSQELNDSAGPILLQETLTAQSAQIDTVSGATYTSEGYLQSLQSALDQVGAR